MHIAEATLSPGSKRIILTPWVDLLNLGIEEISVLITWPLREITIKSSSSPLKTVEETNSPVLGVTLAVLMPLPPLFCSRYSPISVLLPYPFSVTASKY